MAFVGGFVPASYYVTMLEECKKAEKQRAIQTIHHTIDWADINGLQEALNQYNKLYIPLANEDARVNVGDAYIFYLIACAK